MIGAKRNLIGTKRNLIGTKRDLIGSKRKTNVVHGSQWWKNCVLRVRKRNANQYKAECKLVTERNADRYAGREVVRKKAFVVGKKQNADNYVQ